MLLPNDANSDGANIMVYGSIRGPAQRDGDYLLAERRLVECVACEFHLARIGNMR